MKKYLISLEKDQQRRTLFFSQPNTQDFQHFNAINTMNEEWEILAKYYDLNQFQKRYHRQATKGEIGCTLSHLGVYQQILADNDIQDNEYSLICEDDALFNQNIQTALTQLVKQESSADMILIGQSKIADFDDKLLEIEFPTTFKPYMKAIGETIYRYAYPYRPYFAGTVAYLIKKSAIQKFLATENQPFWLADDFILFEQNFRLTIKVVRPLMAIENPNLNSNLAQARNSKEQSFWKKCMKYPLKKLLAIKRNS